MHRINKLIMEAPILNEHNKEEYPPMHTAEHILNKTMIRIFGCERSRKTHIERTKSKLDYNLLKSPTPEQIIEIEQQVNKIITQSLPVTMEYMSQQKAQKMFDLKKLPDDASEMLRIVRIGDYDACPCIGIHVNNTSEIGKFRISSTRFQDGIFRIVFRLN